jgi:arylsulfatase
MKYFSCFKPMIQSLCRALSGISSIFSRPAGFRFLFSYVVLLELAVSQVVLYRLVFDSGKYTVGEALLSQPILLLEAGGWAFLFVFLVGAIKWNWIRRTFCIVLTCVFTLLTLGEFLLLWVYDTVYNPEMSKVIVGTDARESLEFLTAMSHHLPKLLLAAVIMLVAARGLSKLLSTIRTTMLTCIALCCFILGFGLSVGRYRNWHWSYSPARTTTADRFVWGLVRTYRLGKILENQREHMHASAANTITGHVDTGLMEPINVVLILGESTRAASMHCYGFALPTTPKLDELRSRGEIAVFTDVVSPSNATIASTQAMLTFYTNEQDKEQWHEYPDLVSVMKHGGFTTAWVTNQECSGGPWSVQQLFGTAADTLTGNAYRLHQTNDMFLSDSLFYDERILPNLLSFEQIAPKHRRPRGLFSVVHLMGSHAGYANRYPASFARFRTKDIPGTLAEGRKTKIAEYANSVLYNDHVVAEIFKRYSQSRSIVIYVSDHGETLFDDKRHPDFAGHAGNTLPDNVVRIPFIVYLSDSLRKEAPELWQQILKAQDQPVMTDLLPNIFTGLLGIETKYSRPELNVFSPHYNPKRQRMVIAVDGAKRVFPALHRSAK